jgi:hypothetical protein
MTSLRGFIESWWTELPHATAARWASLFFSLHILTLLISITATQVFLAAAAVAYLTHLLGNGPIARASCPLWRRHPARARERDAPATAGMTPALQVISFPPIKLPLLLFCLTTFNSVLWAQLPAGGWVSARKLVLFLILLLSVNLITSAKHLEALFRGLFLVSALAGLVGTAQFVIQYRSLRHLQYDRIYYYMTLTRIHGFMGHWMNFGGQQMLVFSALLAFLLMYQGVIPLPQSRERNLGLLRDGLGTKDESKIPRRHENGCAEGTLKCGSLTPPSLLGLHAEDTLRRRQAAALQGASRIFTHGGEPKDHGILARNGSGQEGKGKGLYWLVMAVVATSLVLNFTRGVWLGCLVATLYLVSRWKPRALWLVPALLVVAYLAAPSMLRRRVSLAFHPSDDPALAMRLEIWGAGLRMVQKHPWVGVGPENIPQVYTQYLPPGTKPLPGYHDHLHNNLLQLAAERGLPCLVTWLWFMLALGWNILRIRGRLSRQRWVADAALAAWLAFFAEGFFEYNFGTSPVLMVFLFVMSTPFVAEHLESRVQEPGSPL